MRFHNAKHHRHSKTNSVINDFHLIHGYFVYSNHTSIKIASHKKKTKKKLTDEIHQQSTSSNQRSIEDFLRQLGKYQKMYSLQRIK